MYLFNILCLERDTRKRRKKKNNRKKCLRSTRWTDDVRKCDQVTTKRNFYSRDHVLKSAIQFMASRMLYLPLPLYPLAKNPTSSEQYPPSTDK